MGRDEPGSYHPRRWSPPTYSVNDQGKVVGGYLPTGPHNWGRWGEDDRCGTLNTITPDLVVRAAGLVSRGRTFSLALPISGDAPRWWGRRAPLHYFTMTGSDAVTGLPHSGTEPGVTFTDDYLDMALQASTQWDGFAHWSVQDCLYNGFWAGSITSAGSHDLEVSAWKDKIVGRGVLLDVARFSGVDPLPPGTAITAEVLDATAKQQDVTVGTGDIVLVRTGHLAHWYELTSDDERSRWGGHAPGLSRSTVSWLHELDIAALASDTQGVEVAPNEEPIVRPHPLHQAALIDLGLPLGELWWLEDLARDCAEDGAYEFLLVAPPLNLPGAVGSVLNPQALK
jgi:kynurenine formamidase